MRPRAQSPLHLRAQRPRSGGLGAGESPYVLHDAHETLPGDKAPDVFQVTWVSFRAGSSRSLALNGRLSHLRGRLLRDFRRWETTATPVP